MTKLADPPGRSRRGAAVFAALLLAFVLAGPSTAIAGPEEEAQKYFEKGAALYFEGEYGQALVEFKKGQSTLPNSLFLYNIALCHLKLDRYREALASARQAREMGGLGEREATLNDARIAAIVTIRGSRAVANRVEATEAAASESSTAPDVQAQTPTTTDSPSSGRFGTLGWVGVGATTVGAGLLTAALVTEVSLQPKWEEFQEAGRSGDTDRHAELREEIEPVQQRGKIFLFSGIGVASVGVILIIVDLITPGQAEEKVGLLIGGDMTIGARATWRF